MDVLNGKINIKKYYFGFFYVYFAHLKEVLNKMLKYLFSLKASLMKILNG
jgi:hypothetical protein